MSMLTGSSRGVKAQLEASQGWSRFLGAEIARWHRTSQAVSLSSVRRRQDLCPRVTAPTLVLHCHGDLRIPVGEGRLLASLIPGARFVPLASRNHIPLEHEPAWRVFLDTVRSFLGV